MTVEYSTGAESGVEWTAVGNAAISTAQAHKGTHSIRCNPTADASYIHHQYRADSQDPVFYRCYVRFATFPDQDCVILAHTDSGVVQNLPGLRFIAATQKLQVWDNSGVVGSPSVALDLNTWHRIELDYDDSQDLTSAYLDGIAFATDVNGGDLFGGGTIKVGIITTATADMYVDDVTVFAPELHIEEDNLEIRYSVEDATEGDTLAGALDLAMGGYMGTNEVVTNVAENFLPDVSGPQTIDGLVRYRCYFLLNNHPTLTYTGASVALSGQTSGGSTIAVAADGEGASMGDSTELQATTIDEETDVPSGVGSWSTSASLGDIGPYGCRAFWLRQTTNAGASLVAPDQVVITVSGETL